MSSPVLLYASDGKDLPAGSCFLQSRFWALLKSGFGWQPLYFTLDDKAFIVLVRKLGRYFSLAYVPHAPDSGYQGSLGKIAQLLKNHLPAGCVFIRFDLPWESMNVCEEKLLKAAVDIQPPSTVVIDLSLGRDAVLSGMKSKTRYNIRLAEKKGVAVARKGVEFLDEWYDIYRETAARDRIALHSPDYYRKIFELAGSREERGFAGQKADIRLYMAESEGKNLAGIITCFYGRGATYLYGASRNTGREKMPAYALQWKAICDALDEGCLEYDLFGIPPADDEDHPMHGLYRFKTGFGGRIIHRAGCYDYPLMKGVYSLYRAAEIARNHYYKKIRKR